MPLTSALLVSLQGARAAPAGTPRIAASWLAKRCSTRVGGVDEGGQVLVAVAELLGEQPEVVDRAADALAALRQAAADPRDVAREGLELPEGVARALRPRPCSGSSASAPPASSSFRKRLGVGVERRRGSRRG